MTTGRERKLIFMRVTSDGRIAYTPGASALSAYSICTLAVTVLTARFHVRELRLYRVADKSLARPGRKQATATEHSEFHISYL